MEPMKLSGRNGYGYSVGMCCWDADRGSRKEATFIPEHKVNGYRSGAPYTEDYAMEWARWSWEQGSARVARYRVAVSNGKETVIYTVKVSSIPQPSVEAGSEQTMVDLDTLSMEESK